MPDHTPPRSAAESFFDPAEDRHSQHEPKAPRDRGSASVPVECHRQGERASPLPPAGGDGGGSGSAEVAGLPLTSPASGRGTERPAPTPTRAIPRQATSAVAYRAPVPEEDDPLLGFAPYIHKQPRRNSITPPVQRRFIAELAATGIVKQAALKVGKSLEALYKIKNRPGAEGFSEAWEAALDRGVQRLEDCAMERALNGTPTPIVSGGEILGHWDKPDNNLLRFLLRQRMPARYGAEGGGPGGKAAPAAPATPKKPLIIEEDDRWIEKINRQFEILRRKAIMCGEFEPTESEAAAIARDKAEFYKDCL